jgi:predicted dehydrogenase
MPKTEQLRIGIVGVPRGRGQLSAIEAAGSRVTLAGCYDPNPKAMETFAAGNDSIKQFADFEAAVEGCDLLIIASPQQYHAPQAAFALGHGVHVLSEVPAAVSMEQVNALLAAARASSAQYMIAENYCYSRENLTVAAMAKAGLFGDLYFGEAEYVHEMKGYQFDPSGNPTWRHFWQVGKNGVTYPTHCLGPLLQWMDDRIVALSCVGTGRWTKPQHDIEDTVILEARMRKGGLVRMRLDLLSNRPHLMNFYGLQGTRGAYESGRLFGDKPRVYIEGHNKYDEWLAIEDFTREHLPERYRNPPKGSGHWGSDAFPLLDFLDAIEQGTKPPLGIYEALEMTLPGIVSEQSIAQSGAWLSVPDPRTLTAGIGINPGKEAPLA